MPTTLISVGQSCQTAHQLARFCAKYPEKAELKKGPFDWLICPIEGACSWLEADLEDFGSQEIRNFRDHAYWDKHQFWFWHGFMTKTDEGRELNIERNIDRESSKLMHQRATFQKLDPDNTCFVFSNTQNNLDGEVFPKNERDSYTLDTQKAARLNAALSAFFAFDINLQIVSRMDRISPDLMNTSNVALLDKEPSQWKGCDEDWDDVLLNAL